MENIDITAEQLAVVSQLLCQHLPKSTIVWVYGSRATHTAKQYSDLDIALEQHNGQFLDIDLIMKLINEFEESNLPYKVDIMDYKKASGIFKQNVDTQKVKLVWVNENITTK
jgi:type I restriction enzyme S subunit